MIYKMETSSLLSYKVKLMLAVCTVSMLIAVSWLAYTWYMVDQAKKTQILLSECLDEYQKTLESKTPMWSELVVMNDLAIQQAHFAPMKPYLLIMKAQALACQNEIEQAVDVMNQAESMISDRLPYKKFYMLTKSLMQLDAADGSLQQQGLAQLQQLAYDVTNVFRDAALFNLAAYYQAHHEPLEVANIIKILEDDPALKDSLWTVRAKESFII